MVEIVNSIQRVTSIMSEIMMATQEQTAGIEQINEAIVQMDDVTQQNAALVEQAAASASALQNEADHLSQLVSTFQLANMTAIPLAGTEPVTKRVTTTLPGKKAAVVRAQTSSIKRLRQVNDTAPEKKAASDAWEEF